MCGFGRVAIITATIMCAASARALATPAHSTIVVRSERGPYAVEFHPWGAPVVVRNSETTTSVRIEWKQLRNFMDQPEVSTAGCWWYKNALAFFTPDGNSLVIRLGDGGIVGIDVVQGCPMEEIPRSLAEIAGQQSRELAAKLLESRNAFERETGAIVSGQERIRETIPRLRALLNDETYGTTGVDMRHKTRDYFVRRAAVSALRSMGEVVGNVTVEEPDPPWDDREFSPSPFPPITPAGPAR